MQSNIFLYFSNYSIMV